MMITLESCSPDTVFSESYTKAIILDRYGIYIHKKWVGDLVKFTQLYWDSVKGYGRYLEDVNFYDLNKDEREDMTCRAFLMWTNYMVETKKMVK